MSLIDLIKHTAIKAVEATNPVKVMFGTVLSTNPLEIEVESRMKLTEDFLVLTERVTRYEVDLEHDHSNDAGITTKGLTAMLIDTPIRTGLSNGDKVVLLRVQGGHQFVVLDKVVS